MALSCVCFCPGEKRDTPKIDLTRWLPEKIIEVNDKGTDILLCHFPWKGMLALTEQNIRKDYEDMLGNIVRWDSGYPVLNDNINTNLQEIVVVNKLGGWIIEIGYSNNKKCEPSTQSTPAF